MQCVIEIAIQNHQKHYFQTALVWASILLRGATPFSVHYSVLVNLLLLLAPFRFNAPSLGSSTRASFILSLLSITPPLFGYAAADRKPLKWQPVTQDIFRNSSPCT